MKRTHPWLTPQNIAQKILCCYSYKTLTPAPSAIWQIHGPECARTGYLWSLFKERELG
jgi:hypothetical protein